MVVRVSALESVKLKVTSALEVNRENGGKEKTEPISSGEISLQGRVRPVGGVFEKAYGAKQAGIVTMIIPKENEKDIPEGHLGLSICPVERVEEALEILFGAAVEKTSDPAKAG